MATAVLPMASLSLSHEIMPPSPLGANASRHGRNRSIAKSKGRGRGYSIVDDREGLIAKALIFVLKRTVEEGDDEDEEKLVADAEGWVDVEEALQQPNVSAIGVTFPELQALVASPASKSRFALKSTTPGSEDPASFLLRLNPAGAPPPASPTVAKLTPLSTTTEDLPDLIVYESSYPNYPLILASGGIKRAGGQVHLQFHPLSADDEEISNSKADVSIYVNLREVMEADGKITWWRTESGSIVTEGNGEGVLEKKHWQKAVARRADIGVLFADGQVKKEVPIGLRGKNVKGKRGGGKGKGREVKENVKARSDDDGTGSD